MLTKGDLMKDCLFFLVAFLSIVIFNSCKEKLIDPEDIQLKILFPNGGESLKIDSIYTTIRWQSQGVERINIFYSADNGANWQIISENQDASSGQYLWEIPGNTTNYGLVKISTSDATFQDVSDNCFRISFSPEYIGEALKYYPLSIGNVWVSVVNVES